MYTKQKKLACTKVETHEKMINLGERQEKQILSTRESKKPRNMKTIIKGIPAH